MSKDTIGQGLLVEWMKRHRIKQTELARRTGVSQATISKVLRGSARPGMSLVLLIELATAYNADGSRPVANVEAISWLTAEELDRAEGLDHTRRTSVQVAEAELLIAEASHRTIRYRGPTAAKEAQA